jgi:hypothetical protein
MADDISSGLRTAEGARGAVTLAEENGPEAADAVPAEVTGGTVVVGADEDIVDPEGAIVDAKTPCAVGLAHQEHRRRERGC